MSRILYIDIAQSPHQLQQGLMFVKKMANDRGMLFKFQKPQVLQFWGANTFIPLDIAFIKDGKIAQIKQIKAHDLNTVRSSCDCDMAVQVNMGYFDRYNIKPGCGFRINKCKDNGDFMEFTNELV